MTKRSSSKRARERYFLIVDEDLGIRFANILIDGCEGRFDVELMTDVYGYGCPDEIWIPGTASTQRIVITRDGRIRRDHENVVGANQARILVVAGKRTHPEHAENFVENWPIIERYLDKNVAPFMARITAPKPEEVAKKRNAKGKVSTFYPRVK